MYKGLITKLLVLTILCNLSLKCVAKNDKSYSDGIWTVKWEDSGDSTEFTFSTKITGNDVWSAFALSNDQKMVKYQKIISLFSIILKHLFLKIKGDDDVIVCKSYNNQMSIEHLHNDGHSTPQAIKADDLQIGLSNTNIKYQDGHLECSFKRLKSYDGENKYFSVKGKMYYILTGHGRTSASKHFSKYILYDSIKNFQNKAINPNNCII